jgi:hypothetical protein
MLMDHLNRKTCPRPVYRISMGCILCCDTYIMLRYLYDVEVPLLCLIGTSRPNYALVPVIQIVMLPMHAFALHIALSDSRSGSMILIIVFAILSVIFRYI